jgi:hypothetical protein
MTRLQQEAFSIEERRWLINRLEAIERNPRATAEDKRIACDMLKHYRDGQHKRTSPFKKAVA